MNLYKHLNINFWSLILILLIGNNLQGQFTLQISNDKTGKALENVEAVSISSGNSLGKTDENGILNLNSPKGTEILLTKENFENYTTVLGNDNRIFISLAPKVESVEEVVIVGYNSQKRREITGSVGSVKGADLIKQPVLTGTQAIQGKLAGVQITNFGSPGSAPTVRIRGTGSVIGGAEPLYVVDGIITDDIRNIATTDIVSIDVLKDASSTAIYGVRAANGVILITTRAGKRGTSELRYDSYFGFKSLTNKVYMSGPNSFATYSNEAAGDFAIKPEQITGKTDWMDAITRTGLQQNHSISLSGGGNKSASFLSVNYMKESGILLGNDYERITIRNNNDY